MQSPDFRIREYSYLVVRFLTSDPDRSGSRPPLGYGVLSGSQRTQPMVFMSFCNSLVE